MRIFVVSKQNVCLYPRISRQMLGKIFISQLEITEKKSCHYPPPTEPRRLLENTEKLFMLLPPPPTESRRLLGITEKTQEIQQPQLGSSAYQCRTNYFKYSYFPHTVVLWNSLPQAVVSSPTLEAFKTSLRRCRMPQIYNSDNVRGDIVITL